MNGGFNPSFDLCRDPNYSKSGNLNKEMSREASIQSK